MRTARMGWAIGLAALAAGCAFEETPDDAEEIGEAEAPVVNGVAVTPGATAQTSGIVSVWNDWAASACTGDLITNDWVITAAHCQPWHTNFKVTAGNYIDGYQDKFYLPDFYVIHPTLDVALVHLRQAVPVDWDGVSFKMGFYPNDTGNGPFDYLYKYNGKLLGKTLNLLGYGTYDAEGHWGGLHQAYLQATGGYDSYTFAVGVNGSNQIGGPGDSGGAIFLDTVFSSQLPLLMNRVIVGIVKSGNGATTNFIRAEHLRDWALSYIYDRPIPMPKASFTDATPAYLWKDPMEHSFNSTGTWNDPCTGRPYTWTATYDLESGYDWVDVTNGGMTRRLTGWNGTTGPVSAQGALTLRVHTDVNNSTVPGGLPSRMKSFDVRCDLGGVSFPNPWNNAGLEPVPAGLSDSVEWEPCVGGDSFTWTASYEFRNGDRAIVDGTALTGAGTLSRVGHGALEVDIDTGAGGQSPGITSLKARCDMAVECHGPTCFTVPQALPSAYPYREARSYWNPCGGGAFTWRAKYDFEQNYDYVNIANSHLTGSSASLAGGYFGPIAASGPLYVTVHTDVSVSSRGLIDLVANCNAWNLPL